MRHNPAKEFLGVDVGAIRVGIARGSDAARLAQPLKTVSASQAVDELAKLAAAHQAAGIVIGLPRGLDGEDTGQTQLIRAWAALAKDRINLPFYWQDEALTSVQASDKHQTPNIKHQKYDEHAVAAAIILQDFLNTDKDDRVEA